MFLQELQLFLASHPGFSNSTSAQTSFLVGPISSCIIKLKFGNVGLSGGRANLRSTYGKTKITHSTHLYGTGPKSSYSVHWYEASTLSTMLNLGLLPQANSSCKIILYEVNSWNCLALLSHFYRNFLLVDDAGLQVYSYEVCITV